MTRYTVEYVDALRLHCVRIGVLAPWSFWVAAPKQVAEAFNGVGPERWCPACRAVVSWLLKPFFTAALPHDWEYSLPEKSFRAFTRANLRFAWNSCLEALDERRPSMIATGLLLALLCQLFGWSGYRNGRTVE